MTVQFLINWDNIFAEYAKRKSAGDVFVLQNITNALYRLTEYIFVNGCAVETEFVLCALNKIDPTKDQELSSLQSVWNGVYKDCGLKIDLAQRASTLQSTLSIWQSYIRNSGIIALTGDSRFVVVDCVNGHGRGPFYIHLPLNSFLHCEELGRRAPELIKWRRLQHHPSGSRMEEFRRYLRAFGASSVALLPASVPPKPSSRTTIRIYDPYLAEMFLPLKCPEPQSALLPRNIGERVKKWRNSFRNFFGVFADNNHIQAIEVITQWTEHCEKWTRDAKDFLRLDEVVEDTILNKFASRRESLRVDFHFVSQETSFHDRFLSNGRLCFSIGRGVDICSDKDAESTSDFNVFYGCTKREIANARFMAFGFTAQLKLPVCSLEMYPPGCTARRGSSVVKRFSAGRKMTKTNTENEFIWKNPIHNTVLTVSVNPYVGEEDF